mgnify:CR=1 FL=1
MQKGKAVRILINLFVIAAATISMIPFVLMFFMATQDNQMIFAGDIFRLGKALKNNFQTILDADYFRSLLNSSKNLFLSISLYAPIFRCGLTARSLFLKKYLCGV